MKNIFTRLVHFVTNKKWAEAKNFLSVAGILFGFVAGASTTVLLVWYPDKFEMLRDRFSGDPRVNNPLTQTEHSNLSEAANSGERWKANRCREQMLSALNRDEFELARTAARCAEFSYKEAIEQRDLLGAYGLFDLYQDTRLTSVFSDLGDRATLDELAKENWCLFVISNKASELKMTEMQNEIICE